MQSNIDILTTSDISNELAIHMRQTAPLADETLAYFQQLKQTNIDVYSVMLEQFKTEIAPVERLLFLQPHHINAVVRLLEAQKKLEPSILTHLETYLHDFPNDFNLKIKKLSAHLSSFIDDQAVSKNLLHHTVAHALEMKVRTMYLITHKLHYFSKNNAVDNCLYQLVAFAIAHHDFYQQDNGSFPTVEERTADQVKQWVCHHLLDSPPQQVVDLVSFIADYVIILGTTMVYSPESTLDLSELFCFFQKHAQAAGCFLHDESNTEFLTQMKHISLITGLCDKFPAAVLQSVDKEYQIANSEHTLQHYLSGQDQLILEHFFTQLQPYHVIEGDLQSALAVQAFLMAVVPHLCMRIELSFIKTPTSEQDDIFNTHLKTLVQFINDCKRRREGLLKFDQDVDEAMIKDLTDEFINYFIINFNAKAIENIMSTVFFEKIDKEIAFVRSQTNSLTFFRHELSTLLSLDINAQASEIDALNLSQLKAFYHVLSLDDQKKLSSELVLIAIFQVGSFYYASHPNYVDQTIALRENFASADLEKSKNSYQETQNFFFRQSFIRSFQSHDRLYVASGDDTLPAANTDVDELPEQTIKKMCFN